jgi:hypothetical protein
MENQSEMVIRVGCSEIPLIVTCSSIPEPATVLAVRESSDGYWYIGAGRSIADGPYRYPQQLLTVASDLLSTRQNWRIDVFDAAGRPIISYNSDDLAASDLDCLARQRDWSRIDGSRSITPPSAG